MHEAATRAVNRITSFLGSFPAIAIAALLVTVWFVGAIFVKGHLGNNTYQLLINTGTTIITFLMVFIIQNTQNRDGKAMQTKLDALIDAIQEHTDQELLGIEDQPEQVIKKKHERVKRGDA